MDQLLPDRHAALDVEAAYAADARPAPPDRPWVLVNMIASLDGATAVDGASGGLGGPADKEVFRAIRALPDVILVAAGTVRAERYGPPRLSEEAQARRVHRGQAPTPRLAIVTRSLDLDPSAPLFTQARPDARPIILTTGDADEERAGRLGAVADVRRVGETQVDLEVALSQLRHEGLAALVLCEGGPSLNGTLVQAGLVDELCLSLAPMLVGGVSPRLAHGEVAHPTALRLTRVLEADGLLFLRYVRPPAAD